MLFKLHKYNVSQIEAKTPPILHIPDCLHLETAVRKGQLTVRYLSEKNESHLKLQKGDVIILEVV